MVFFTSKTKSLYTTVVYSCVIKMPVKYGKWEMCWSGTQHYIVNDKPLCGSDVVIYEKEVGDFRPTLPCKRCMKLRGEKME